MIFQIYPTKVELRRFKVGSKVTTCFYIEEKSIVRTITGIKKTTGSESGVRIKADGGVGCCTCGRGGASIPWIDGAWFLPASDHLNLTKGD